METTVNGVRSIITMWRLPRDPVSSLYLLTPCLGLFLRSPQRSFRADPDLRLLHVEPTLRSTIHEAASARTDMNMNVFSSFNRIAL
jgi:hypothetical protein